MQQPKVTNMNVDKRKYLSKYIEQTTDTQTKMLKKSVTPEQCYEVAKKNSTKILPGKVSSQNKYEIMRNKRPESVFIPNTTKDTSTTHISPKILPVAKKIHSTNEAPKYKIP